ncbi:glycerol-3-phosphate transporter [Borrelia turicatae]|uniref:Glycerol-3-phosphate transporter n=2 Tax=Borrelia turicatae TaxID=142 RepID=A0A172XAN3_BORTU|nr:glycerol-3-phosphate transporter [Borrelia turicatae]AAX17578.1 glycerol-3-phosphate transporter [Borrelia turicatae 91E135]ANF33735.1 glycerol-3-phosphate transporter [Borrelia turicatae]UPA13103.1 glycerol-3-phosphate transporter [Borrelia turicatae 91E135]UPA14589.1 glycerol-3-phosphate transporter [Borrelia turicatae]
MKKLFDFLKPAPHIKRVHKEIEDSLYKKLRLQIFISIFIGYAGFYLTRKIFSFAIPELEKEGFNKGQLGIALSGVSIAYGFSKFIMGNISDRSNPRYFLALGLLLTAIITLLFGLFSWQLLDPTTAIMLMFILMFANGWVQGMGWPACGRTMVHWWAKKERGITVATWNLAHNIGGGAAGIISAWALIHFKEWQAIFYVPAILVLGIAIFILITLRDTPQSVGLPPIEEYKNDYPDDYTEEAEKELNAKDIFIKYVLNNKLLWYIATANAFIYFVRYGVLDWAPSYLSQVKNFSIKNSGWAYSLYEFSAIPGTIICGWISDKIFKGRRSETGIIFMTAALITIIIYWQLPENNPTLTTILLAIIGFLIYGPVMLIGLHALDLAPKKAAGTAAGFTGLFGYIGGSVTASAITGLVLQHFNWNVYFYLLITACIFSILFISLTLKQEKKINNTNKQ